METKKMKDYKKDLNWAVIQVIDRSTQDDHVSKIEISGATTNPILAEEMAACIPGKSYIIHMDRLEQFEAFYNYVQDINENFGDHAIYHINDGGFSTDELNIFRSQLGLWTDTKIK